MRFWRSCPSTSTHVLCPSCARTCTPDRPAAMQSSANHDFKTKDPGTRPANRWVNPINFAGRHTHYHKGKMDKDSAGHHPTRWRAADYFGLCGNNPQRYDCLKLMPKPIYDGPPSPEEFQRQLQEFMRQHF